jgi:predicted amidohydrolase YtcJ
MRAADARPTLILHGGTVHPLDGDRPATQAIALAGDTILALGDDASILALRAPDTRVIDLAGRSAMPGLYDAHPHLDRLGLRERAGLDIGHCRSIAQIVDAVREAAERTPAGEWIVLRPMGEPPDGYVSEAGQLAEGRFPDRHDLDRAAPGHPVFIRPPWGWWTRLPLPAVANTRAMTLAGIGRGTPAPHRIEIARDARGDPTGLFLERNRAPTVEALLFACVPRFSFEDRLEGLRIGMRLTAQAGITAAYEGHGLTPAVLDAWRQIACAGDLALRMHATLSLPTAAFGDAAIQAQLRTWSPRIAAPGLATGRLLEEGVCLDVADPQVARALARVYPYEGWAGHFAQALPNERLIALGTACARLGIRVSVLVCYELERVLQALEAIDAQVSIRDQRWVVVHVISASPAPIDRMRRLGVIATVTPTFMQHATDRFGLHALGAAGTPIRALLDGGVPVALSTDGVPHSMLFATWQALARRDAETGDVLGDSGLTRREALELASVAGHRLSAAEARRGPLRPGHDADLIVLDGDPLDCALDALPTLPVDLTIVGGGIVQDRAPRGVEATP